MNSVRSVTFYENTVRLVIILSFYLIDVYLCAGQHTGLQVFDGCTQHH